MVVFVLNKDFLIIIFFGEKYYFVYGVWCMVFGMEVLKLREKIFIIINKSN